MEFFRRRRFKREESLHLTHFVMTGSGGTLQGKGIGRTRNISGAGLLLETDTHLRVGQLLVLTLSLSDSLVDLKGRVIHVENFNENWLWAGVEFQELDSSHRATLADYLASAAAYGEFPVCP